MHINTSNANDTVDIVYVKCIIDITMYIRSCTSHVEVVNNIYCLTVCLELSLFKGEGPQVSTHRSDRQETYLLVSTKVLLTDDARLFGVLAAVGARLDRTPVGLRQVSGRGLHQTQLLGWGGIDRLSIGNTCRK